MKGRIDKSISKLNCGTTFILLGLFMFSLTTISAQNSSLSDKAKQQIEKNIANSGDWHKLNQLKTLNKVAPNARHQQQIDEIYETYRFTLVSSEFEQERQQWQIEQQNNKILATSRPPKDQKDPFYYDKLTLAKQQKERELYQLINSENDKITIQNQPTSTNEKDPLFWLADTNSTTFQNYAKHYNSAYNEIVNMLSGKTELNLKRAIFVTENAFFQNKLDYKNYCNQINELVVSCKKIISQNKLNLDNFMVGHFAIQTLFREKISYDFDDYMGENDHTKHFVTKLLNTKTGQCHSLPLLYLILAEELNINAFLGLAPNHSYIKFGNQYQSYNFETTNGNFVSDQWIVASGYVSATAVKNGIYLAPLGKQYVIAENLNYLSLGLEFLAGKSTFSEKCALTTLKFFPNSIHALMILNNLNVANCANTAKKYKFPKETDYYKYPELKKQFDEMVDFETHIEQTGFIQIPPEQYELWQQTVNEAKQQQEHLKFADKLKESVNAN